MNQTSKSEFITSTRTSSPTRPKAVTCEKCHLPLGTKVMKADGFRLWHPKCMLCYNCRRKLQDTWFYTKNKSLFCERCYSNMYLHRCSNCCRTLKLDMADGIKAMESKFHMRCFKCQLCYRMLTHHFAMFKKRPMCLECFSKEGVHDKADVVDKNTFADLTKDAKNSSTTSVRQPSDNHVLL